MHIPVLLTVLLAVALVLYLVGSWFVSTPPAQIARGLRRGVWALVIGLILLLAVTGRLHWLFVLIASLVGLVVPLLKRLLPLLIANAPLLQRIFRQYRTSRTTNNPGAKQHSTVATRFLRMSLDHDSGEMDGEVLEGDYRGRRLNELTLEELTALYREVAQEEDSRALLEAYLDRVHGEAWRHQDHGPQDGARTQSPNGAMSRKEAYEILGLAPDAGDEEVIEAHRRLMQKLHPDRGGSTYLAAKINQAKAVLLDR